MENNIWNITRFFDVEVINIEKNIMSSGKPRYSLTIKPQQINSKFFCSAFDEAACQIEARDIKTGDKVSLDTTLQIYKTTAQDGSVLWKQSYKIIKFLDENNTNFNSYNNKESLRTTSNKAEEKEEKVRDEIVTLLLS